MNTLRRNTSLYPVALAGLLLLATDLHAQLCLAPGEPNSFSPPGQMEALLPSGKTVAPSARDDVSRALVFSLGKPTSPEASRVVVSHQEPGSRPTAYFEILPLATLSPSESPAEALATDTGRFIFAALQPFSHAFFEQEPALD